MIVIGRPINGVTLNGLEYILDDHGDVMRFENLKSAGAYLLKTAKYTWKQIENEGIQLIYTNEYKECDCSQCERNCYIRDKFQRHPPETTNGLGLGLCPKLKEEWTDQWIKTN